MRSGVGRLRYNTPRHRACAGYWQSRHIMCEAVLADNPKHVGTASRKRLMNRALVIGIDTYDDPAIPALGHCVSDVFRVAHCLRRLHFIVTVMHSKMSSEQKHPTKANIEWALDFIYEEELMKDRAARVLDPQLSARRPPILVVVCGRGGMVAGPNGSQVQPRDAVQGGGGGSGEENGAVKKRPETGRNACSKTTGHRAAPHTAVRSAPTGHTTRHKGTMRCEHCSNHQMRRTPSEPSANTPPPSTRCPRTPQGRGLRLGGARQPRMGQSTSYGDVKSLYGGGRRVGQEGVRDMGTQQRRQTGGGATQRHKTREPHQGGQGRAHQTRRRGTARQERQPEQREQGTRMERMVECAHGRQPQ